MCVKLMFSVPTAPINLEAQARSDSEVLLRWQNGNDAPFDSYYITYSNQADPEDRGGAYSREPSYVVEDLQPGATYIFNVNALFQDYVSPESDPAYVTLGSSSTEPPPQRK